MMSLSLGIQYEKLSCPKPIGGLGGMTTKVLLDPMHAADRYVCGCLVSQATPFTRKKCGRVWQLCMQRFVALECTVYTVHDSAINHIINCKCSMHRAKRRRVVIVVRSKFLKVVGKGLRFGHILLLLLHLHCRWLLGLVGRRAQEQPGCVPGTPY